MTEIQETAQSTIRRLGRTLARLVGLVFALLGAWVLVVNLVEVSYSGWALVWILVAGVLGSAGGVLYLLSYDGPDRLRTPPARRAGWLGMLALAVLPSSLSIPLILMALLTIPTVLPRDQEPASR